MTWVCILGLAWWGSGVVSFIYWWTNDYDLTLAGCFGAAAVGIVGPIAFFIGASVHGDHKNSQPFVVMKRRKRARD